MNHSDLISQTGLQKHLKLLAIHSDTFTAASTLYAKKQIADIYIQPIIGNKIANVFYPLWAIKQLFSYIHTRIKRWGHFFDWGV